MRDEKRIDIFLKVLGDEWKRQSPDLRFGQFLINHIGNEDIYNYEESELLFKFFPDIPKREYVTWGTCGKDGKQPLKRVLIKNLEIDNSNNILKTQKLSPILIDVFKNELKLRRKLKIKNFYLPFKKVYIW